jgi:hypothetical protein
MNDAPVALTVYRPEPEHTPCGRCGDSADPPIFDELFHLCEPWVRARWVRLTRAERHAFIRSVGERSAVREFGLSIVDVALALPIRADVALERVARLARG